LLAVLIPKKVLPKTTWVVRAKGVVVFEGVVRAKRLELHKTENTISIKMAIKLVFFME